MIRYDYYIFSKNANSGESKDLVVSQKLELCENMISLIIIQICAKKTYKTPLDRKEGEHI